MTVDADFIRRLLNDWARWLCSSNGYGHQSSLEYFKQGGLGGGVFASSIPKGVEPSLTVMRTSLAMQHLRLIDGEAAYLLAQIYLRKEKARLVDLAVQAGVSLTGYQERRRRAELKLFSLWEALSGPGEAAG
jgi:hypothetical protein